MSHLSPTSDKKVTWVAMKFGEGGVRQGRRGPKSSFLEEKLDFFFACVYANYV